MSSPVNVLIIPRIKGSYGIKNSRNIKNGIPSAIGTVQQYRIMPLTAPVGPLNMVSHLMTSLPVFMNMACLCRSVPDVGINPGTERPVTNIRG